MEVEYTDSHCVRIKFMCKTSNIVIIQATIDGFERFGTIKTINEKKTPTGYSLLECITVPSMLNICQKAIHEIINR